MISSELSGGQQAERAGARDRLDAIADAELAVDALDVRAHSADGDDQLGGDLLVAVPGGEQAEDVELAGGQRLGGRMKDKG